MIRQVLTKNAPAPAAGAYSQGIVVDDKRMYVAGQVPMDSETGVMPQGIAAQTAKTLGNVRAVLEAGGFAMSDVVKATVHLAHAGDFEEFNKAYLTFFSGVLPVRTTVQSVLPKPGILVEVDVIAEK